MPIGNALSIVRLFRKFKPVITSSGTVTGESKNSGFSYQITADNVPISFKMSPIPLGLGLNTTTGLITGTPPNVNAAGTIVTLSATNESGTGTKNLIIKFFPPLPVITSNLNFNLIQDVNGSYNILATNMNGTGYNPLYYASNLPSGLTFNNGTGVITGKVSIVGDYIVPISASNVAGIDGKILVVHVLIPAPVVFFTNTSKPNAKYLAGDTINFSVDATNSPTSFSVGALNPHLSYSNKTFTGTAPTLTNTTSYTVAVSATNGTGTGKGSYSYTIIVPPNITNLPTGIGGLAGKQLISFDITTTNMTINDGWQRYTYTAISAPAGVQLWFDNSGNTYWDGMIVNASNIQGRVELFNFIKGSYVLDVTATNQAGTSSVKRLTMVLF